VNTGTGSELLCLVGTLVVIGLALWLFIRHRRGAARRGAGVQKASPDPSDPYGTVTTEQLSNDANALLVAADDSLKTSEQEMTFAMAQYGPVATAEFATALEASRVDVAAAFHLRQLLDDDVPDDEPTTRSWYIEIIQRCRAADERLDAHVEAFDKLRDLEANVETLIPGLGARRDADKIRVPQSAATYAQLHQRFAPAAILAVSNSGQQISERLDFADRTLRQAEEAVTADNRPLAALAVRAVEEALGQVEMIFDAVDRLAGDLDAAMASVSSALAAVEADVASGQAALDAASRGAVGAASAGTVDLAAAVAGAAQVTQAVRGEMAAALPDPFAALRRLEQVDVRLSAALANIRDAAGRAERARVMLETAIPAARAEIAAVTNFITTRRGAVGPRPVPVLPRPSGSWSRRWHCPPPIRSPR
jgi:hypothetical protein